MSRFLAMPALVRSAVNARIDGVSEEATYRRLRKMVDRNYAPTYRELRKAYAEHGVLTRHEAARVRRRHARYAPTDSPNNPTLYVRETTRYLERRIEAQFQTKGQRYEFGQRQLLGHLTRESLSGQLDPNVMQDDLSSFVRDPRDWQVGHGFPQGEGSPHA